MRIVAETLTRNTLSGTTVTRDYITASSLYRNRLALLADKYSQAIVALGKLKLCGLATVSYTQNLYHLIDTFNSPDGTLLCGNACDTGQTRNLIFGTSADLTIVDKKSQFAYGALYYNVGYTYTQIQLTYTSANNGGFNDLYFYITNGTYADGYSIRLSTGNVQLLDYTVGFLTWTTGVTSGYTSGSYTLLPTASGVTLTIVDDTLGTQVLTYVGSMRNASSTQVGMAGNAAVPNLDNLYVL